MRSSTKACKHAEGVWEADADLGPTAAEELLACDLFAAGMVNNSKISIGRKDMREYAGYKDLSARRSIVIRQDIPVYQQ